MNSKKAWLVAVVCLLSMGAAATVLRSLQSTHRLGEPGVKLVPVPLMSEDGDVATTNSIAFPEHVLDYQSILAPIQNDELALLPPDTTFGRRLYTNTSGFQAYVTGVLMGTDRTSLHKPEYCLPGQGFQIRMRSQQTIRIDRPHPYDLPVTRLDAVREVRQPDGKEIRQSAIYVYWFLSDTRLSNDHLQRMWWLATDLVRTGELQRWAYIGCLGACVPGSEDAAYAEIERLIQALVPEFQLTTGPATAAQAQLPILEQPQAALQLEAAQRPL